MMKVVSFYHSQSVADFFFSLCKLNSACAWFFGLLKRDITGQPDGK